MNYDNWLQSDKDFEKYHGLNDEEDRERERIRERQDELRFREWKETKEVNNEGHKKH